MATFPCKSLTKEHAKCSALSTGISEEAWIIVAVSFIADQDALYLPYK
jgi:hypothetical protein